MNSISSVRQRKSKVFLQSLGMSNLGLAYNQNRSCNTRSSVWKRSSKFSANFGGIEFMLSIRPKYIFKDHIKCSVKKLQIFCVQNFRQTFSLQLLVHIVPKFPQNLDTISQYIFVRPTLFHQDYWKYLNLDVRKRRV